MAGLESILNMISSQQKDSENAIISAAEKKAERITNEGNEKAQKEYDEAIKKSEVQLALDFENGKSSVDAKMKRRILAYKVKCIDDITEKTLTKLNGLSDDEYFSVLGKLLGNKAEKGRGVISLNEKDLKRVTKNFRETAEKFNAEISEKPVDIENGFILSYGLISENCSFRAIIDSERESVRSIIAENLFGQVKK